MGLGWSEQVDTNAIAALTDSQPLPFSHPVFTQLGVITSELWPPFHLILNHNTQTANVRRILLLIAQELNRLPRDLDAPFPWIQNLIEFAQGLLLHCIGRYSFDELEMHLNVPIERSIDYSDELGDQNIDPSYPRQAQYDDLFERKLEFVLMEALVDGIIHMPLNEGTQKLHLKMVSLALVCLSTQMYHVPLAEQDHRSNIFLNILMTEEFITGKKDALIQKLLELLTWRLHDSDVEEEKESQRGVLQTTSKLIFYGFDVLLYPVKILFDDDFDYFEHPLPTTSGLLLLALIHQQIGYNDSLFDLMDNDLAPNSDRIVQIPFQRLYDSLVVSFTSVHGFTNDWAFILLFTIINKSSLFREYVFTRSDLDEVVVPILKILYNEGDLSSDRAYILIATLLILSEDEDFASDAHTRLYVNDTSWFNDAKIRDVSLGSFMIMVLLRTLRTNLYKLKDAYYHSNCLAVLCNMAPYCQNIHPKAASTMVSILAALAQQYNILQKKYEQKEVEVNDTEEQEDEFEDDKLATFGDFVRLLLEIHLSCLCKDRAKKNIDLVYCLLRERKLLKAFKEDDNFWEVAGVLDRILEYLEGVINELSSGHTLTVEQVRDEIIGTFAENQEFETSFEFSRFCYENLDDAHEFFLPYVWESVFVETDLPWEQSNLLIFDLEVWLALFISNWEQSYMMDGSQEIFGEV